MTEQDGPSEIDRTMVTASNIPWWPFYCKFCGASSRIIADARAHDATCPQHPAVQETENLNRLIVLLNATIIEHDRQNDVLLAEAEAHAREVTRLLAECVSEKADLVEQLAVAKRFIETTIKDYAWGLDIIDGGDLQARAVANGILLATTYDPALHGEQDAEVGDPWYVIAPEWRVQP
jgi:hypothetical protein